jgi:hypothetical protein
MKQTRSTRDGPVTKRPRLDPQPAIAELRSAENIVDLAAEGSWNSSSTIRLVEEVRPAVVLKPFFYRVTNIRRKGFPTP